MTGLPEKLRKCIWFIIHSCANLLHTCPYHKVIHFSAHGIRMNGLSHSANKQMSKGIYEAEEIEVIKKALSGAEVFVDAGANIGFYSCIACSLGKYVVAIEPQPKNLRCLYANLKDNNWQNCAEVWPIGLYSRAGLLELYNSPWVAAPWAVASLVRGWYGQTKCKRIIPVHTLDAILGNRFRGKKLVIKIDVEGAEYDVLLGAVNTLRMSPRPTWMVEISNEFHPGNVNPNYQATFDLFKQHGYSVRCIGSSKLDYLFTVEQADKERI